MARPGFYDDNEARAYPFLSGTPFLPDSAIVCCGFLLGPGSGFLADEHHVALEEVWREASRFLFVFRSTAPGLAGQSIVFARNIDDPPYTIEYADILDNREGSVSASFSAELGCSYGDQFSGHLITGKLDDLLLALPAPGMLAGEAIVEPALLLDVSQSYVRTVNLANGDRTRYTTAAGCKPQCRPHDLQDIYVAASCLQGPIRFREGYNLLITQDSRENSLRFDAQVGGGLGEPCEQPTVFPGETPPHDSLFLEGGPACNEVIRSINGRGGPNFELTGRRGVQVSFQPDQHKITVDVSLYTTNYCAPDDGLDDVSCSEVSESSSDCECGEA